MATLIALGAATGVLVRAALALEVPVVIASIASVSATPQDSESVQAFLKTYESTLASGRAPEIVKLYVDPNHGREAVLDDYFATVIKDLVVRLDDVSITVNGDQAAVAFKRTDSFVDRKTDNRIEKSVTLDRQLQRAGSSWKIALAE
jgi:hypothetical protein